MNQATVVRYRPLKFAVESLLAAIADAAKITDEHGPTSDREAEAFTEVGQRAILVAIVASELEANAEDAGSRFLARLCLAEHVTGLAKDAAPFPLDAVSGYVHSAALLLEQAGEEIICMPTEGRRG